MKYKSHSESRHSSERAVHDAVPAVAGTLAAPWSVALALGVHLFWAASACAATHYVDCKNQKPVSPYTDWSTAATNIQDAVDVSVAGDQILVADGVYRNGGRAVAGFVGNRVAVTKAITLQSLNGPGATTIMGNQVPGTTNGYGAIRCVYLTNGAALVGFTLSGGATYSGGDDTLRSGGALWCEPAALAVSNCILTGCAAALNGGGAYRGTLVNCTLTNNWATSGGGAYQAALTNCTLAGNAASSSGGGEAYGVLVNCVLASNTAPSGGGAYYGNLWNCTLLSNNAGSTGGGAYSANLTNCTLLTNSAGTYGGGASYGALAGCAVIGNLAASAGGGAYYGTLMNCTVSRNWAPTGGGGYYGTGNNCILYYNNALSGANYKGSTLNYCCVTPVPADGVGNFDAEPQLASSSHLSAGSPGRGAGSPAYALGLDIDGEPWSNPPSVGCDEPSPATATGPISAAIQIAYTNVAVGFTVDLFSSLSGEVTASRWEFDDGSVLSNWPYASRSWASAGDYLVVLRAYNTGNPGGITATASVHVVSAPVHYVVPGNLAPQPPYDSWATAATNIHDAVDATTVAGAVVLVTNGVYQTGGRAVYPSITNRVAVTKPVTVQSVNGPAFTTIIGASGVRCVYLINGAGLMGFTLTNGATPAAGDSVQAQSGGGVWCASQSCVVSNCVIAGNHATYVGGGAFQGMLAACVVSNNVASRGGGVENGLLDTCLVLSNQTSSAGGGVEGGKLTNCVLSANSSGNAGGGATQATLAGCILSSNSAVYGGGSSGGILVGCLLSGNSVSGQGGGSYLDTLDHCALLANTALSTGSSVGGGGSYGSTLHFCTVNSNSCSYGGGLANATANNCTLVGNTAATGGGAYSSTLNNCALAHNTASSLGGGIASGTLTNCTLTGNSAGCGGGAYNTPANNSLLFYNTASTGPNYWVSSTPQVMNYCCTTPLPPAGVGNFVTEPQLASASHISAASPCRGAGLALYATGLDLDGEPWANPPAVGCDEPNAAAVSGPLSVSFQVSCTNFGTGYAVDFVADFSGGVSASRWEFGDGCILSNRPYASHAWLAGGDYQVVLRAFNSDNPAGVAAALTVHVVGQPVYVSLSSTAATPPYTSWATAATNLNDAVDATVPGGQVLVSNGVYAVGARVVFGAMSNRLAVTKPIIVSSINGPAVTVIKGFQVPGTTNADGAVRCVYLTNGASLVGFTLTNGATRAAGAGDRTKEQMGGGIFCEPGAFVANCWLLNNAASSAGGGNYSGTLSNCWLTRNVSLSGGGASGGSLVSCRVIANSASQSGGGVSSATLAGCVVAGNSSGQGGGTFSCSLTNCVLVTNFTSAYGLGGGANAGYLEGCVLGGNSAYMGGGVEGGSLSRCVLTNCVATYGAGADSAALDRCWLLSNCATSSGGGADSSTLTNCVLLYNSATNDGGGAFWCTLNNCTVVGNTAAAGGGAWAGVLKNTILYYNVGLSGANYPPNSGGYTPTLNYCCTTPGPTNGSGNITNEPVFVAFSSNLRLQSNSPCIDAGTNGLVVGNADLDGRPRIVGAGVDMGAFEFQPGIAGAFIGWLQQYGLPIDGSGDFIDSDHDGLPNWQEWVCGTDPTDSTSALRLLTPVLSPTGVMLSWQSVTNKSYFLQSAGSAAPVPGFLTIATNLLGQAGTTTYTDTNPPSGQALLYRVGVAP